MSSIADVVALGGILASIADFNQFSMSQSVDYSIITTNNAMPSSNAKI